MTLDFQLSGVKNLIDDSPIGSGLAHVQNVASFFQYTRAKGAQVLNASARAAGQHFRRALT